MTEYLSYSLADFIPFTDETYFRLFERLNETQWPVHFAAMLLGIGAIVLVRRGRGRYAAILLAAAWGWVALQFHFRLYAELMQAAPFFGWMFVIQGTLLLGFGLIGRLDGGDSGGWHAWLGYGLVAFGMVLFPFIAPLTGRGWAGAEYFGIAPDPTAIATLGILLIAAPLRWLGPLTIVPVAWCAVSGATLWALGAPSAPVMAAAGGVALAGAVGRAAQQR